MVWGFYMIFGFVFVAKFLGALSSIWKACAKRSTRFWACLCSPFGIGDDEDEVEVTIEDRYYLTNKNLGVVRISLECPSTLDGYYLRNKKQGVVRISLECPSTLWNIDKFQEKALELLKIKSEWVEYLSVDG